MERIKGMVLEINDRRAVILTPDGDFREVPVYRPDWEVGQTIEVPVRDPIVLYDRPQESTKKKRKRGAIISFLVTRRQLRWPAAIVAAAMIIATLLVFGPTMGPQPVYAAVSVDLHDNFRIYVDENQNVVSASAASDQGMQMLQRLQVEGQPLEEVVEQLVQATVAEGRLQPDRTDQVVLMSASVLNDKSQEVADKVSHLKKGLDAATKRGKAKLLSRDVDAPVAVLTIASPELQESAGELGVTVNQYLILLKARELGVDLSVKDMRGKRYVSALRKQGVNIAELLSSIQQDGELAHLSATYHNDLLDDANGKVEKHSKNVVEVQPTPPGARQDSAEPRGEDSTHEDTLGGGNDKGQKVVNPDGATTVTDGASSIDDGPSSVVKPGNGSTKKPNKHSLTEEKVGKWLKKMHPPGLYKAKKNKKK